MILCYPDGRLCIFRWLIMHHCSHWATPRPRWAAALLCWSSCEEIPHVQGQRNPSKMVCIEKGHQRADRLKPQSQTTSQSDHMDHSLSNSMKLSHAVWGHPRWMHHGGEVWKNVVHWRREWQPLSILALRTPWTVWKGKKIGHWKMNSPDW